MTIEELYKIAGCVLKKNNARKVGVYEYEDLLQELVCKAYMSADKYDKAKSSESTFYFTVMNNYLKNIFCKENCDKRKANVLSLDVDINGSGKTLLEKIENDDKNNYQTENKLYLLDVYKNELSPYFKLYIENGITMTQIAKMFGKSKQSVSRAIKKDIEKIKLLSCVPKTI